MAENGQDVNRDESVEIESMLCEAENTCERIQVFARGVRLANREQDTELAHALLDLIQSEFE